jgi:hypothetical protein
MRYLSLEIPARLYIKKCSHCELKYFGKTIKNNIINYNGSGVRWKNHLKYHNAKSIHLWNSDWYYDTSIIRYATLFSKLNKITESKQWANIINENGINGGGDCSQMHKEQVRQTARNTIRERYGVDNYAQSEEFKEKRKKTIKEKYNLDCIGSFLNSIESVNKRNNTNLILYNNACAANKDGNINSKKTQKNLLERNCVKIIKCIIPFSSVSLERGWYYNDGSLLEEYKNYLLMNIKSTKYITKRDYFLNRKEVRILIMINSLTSLHLGQNWFQQPEEAILKIFNDAIKNYSEDYSIALRSYDLIFQ